MWQYDISLSIDGVNWISAGSSANWPANNIATLNGFTPAKYKYMKANFSTTSGGGYLDYIKIYATPPSTKQIKFNTPPQPERQLQQIFQSNIYRNQQTLYWMCKPKCCLERR